MNRFFAEQKNAFYFEEQVIGNGELAIQLSGHVIDFFLQGSRVRQHLVNVHFLLTNISDNLQNSRRIIISV